jgi:hypothetical protein
MRRRRRHTRPVAGIVAVLSIVCSLALVHGSGSANASFPTWNLPFPQTISYRTLSEDWGIKCGQPDSTFAQQVAAASLSGYEIYVVDGMRGSCQRLKAEQMKRLHPEKMVVLYESPASATPTEWPGGTWAGYYLFMNRTTALSSVGATDTQIAVANPQAFSVGDTAAMWLPTPSDPYANSEWVTVTAINGSTLTVTRDIFGMGAKTYGAPPLVAAAATGPGYPQPSVNYSILAPVNPANGQRAFQWMAATLASDFAASYGAPTLDGMELDAAASHPLVTNNDGSIKNVDCNGDGIIDYCQMNAGTPQQVDSFGIGYNRFLRQLKRGLAVYDTDPTRPHKMLLADGENGLRSIEAIDGAEFESYPTWDNYSYSSPALAQLSQWENSAGVPGDRLSYTFTKDATPLYPQMGCGGDTDQWCSNSDYRYGMASALMIGGASGYNNEAGFASPQPWDEEGTVNQATTGLTPGYLGQPLGPAVRTLSYSSGELTSNGGFDTGVLGVSVKSLSPTSASFVQDTTTAAVGSASLRFDVTGLSADPGTCESRVQVALAPTTAGEYTVDFWAKARNTTTGPPALNMGVGIAGVVGPAQRVLLTPTWTHFYLDIDVPTATTKSFVKFCAGEGVGSYWIDAVSVHQGTAGIITREFTNGIVVLNDSSHAQSNIVLPDGPYHHINGVQDRTVNDGSSVGSLLPSIGAKDGVILLRG